MVNLLMVFRLEKNYSGACYQYFKNKITDKPVLRVLKFAQKLSGDVEFYTDQETRKKNVRKRSQREIY